MDDRIELCAETVKTIVDACARQPDDDPDTVRVEGFSREFAFGRALLMAHRDQIIALSRQLPRDFTFQGGGAESFLKLGKRADGSTWTEDAELMEQFCCAAIGSGYAAWIGDKPQWAQFAGGKPYVIFGELWSTFTLKKLETA